MVTKKKSFITLTAGVGVPYRYNPAFSPMALNNLNNPYSPQPATPVGNHLDQDMFSAAMVNVYGNDPNNGSGMVDDPSRFQRIKTFFSTSPTRRDATNRQNKTVFSRTEERNRECRMNYVGPTGVAQL
jgi:hypothetical protein